jgi:hypothetical protein
MVKGKRNKAAPFCMGIFFLEIGEGIKNLAKRLKTDSFSRLEKFVC